MMQLAGNKMTKTHFKVVPERMGITPVDIDLAELVEGDVILNGGELLDVSLHARLLATKLVTGQGNPRIRKPAASEYL